VISRLKSSQEIESSPENGSTITEMTVISFILSMCDYMVSVRRNISQDLNTTTIVCRAQPVIYTGVNYQLCNYETVNPCSSDLDLTLSRDA